MRFLTFILTLSMLLSFQLLQPAEAATPVAVTGDFTGLAELESGRSLYVECAGTGSPTVLLISGYRSRADVWTDDLFDPDAGFEAVFPAISQTTRVCTYDRPGTMSVLDGVQNPSRSDAVPTPRTAEEVVQEMREFRLLVADQEPIVLAAHSMGGLLARLYAATYPEDIAGLVLVDALSEFVQDEMPVAEFAAYATYASEIPDILSNYPEYETIDFTEASMAVRDATTATALPEVPTVVLSKGQPFGLQGETPGFTVDDLERAWVAAQDRLAASLPGAVHETVPESSHYIQLERPDLVIDAIELVIEAARAGETVIPSATP